MKFKLTLKSALLAVTVLGISLTACNRSTPVLEMEETLSPANEIVAGAPIPGRYIIVMNDTDPTLTAGSSYSEILNSVKLDAVDVLQTYGIAADKLDNVYGAAIKGFSAFLSNNELDLLKKDQRIKYIEQDRWVKISATMDKEIEVTAQQVPYGIARVGSADGTGKVAWIIDTGIQLNHPDLNVDVNRSRSFLGTTGLLGLGLLNLGGGNNGSPNDGNGHGTHVAGTVAAKNNDIGVIGVAWNATVVAVRVLDNLGSGATSGVIQGVDYVASAAQPGDAANMSLGGGASTALDNAVANAASKGILFALAAGNDSRNASNTSPARVNGPNIWTVSAIDINDRFASFSNFGNPPVDFAAPGVNINSTWLNGGYRSISGTSMAAPHVCGIILLRGGAPATGGFAINDPDGNPDPIAVK